MFQETAENLTANGDALYVSLDGLICSFIEDRITWDMWGGDKVVYCILKGRLTYKDKTEDGVIVITYDTDSSPSSLIKTLKKLGMNFSKVKKKFNNFDEIMNYIDNLL